MKNVQEKTKTTRFCMNYKHIGMVRKGEAIFCDGFFYTATNNATFEETDHGYEWGVDVEGGPKERLYAGDFHNGQVVTWSW